MKYYVCNDVKEFEFLMKHFNNKSKSCYYKITEYTKVWGLEKYTEENFGFCANECNNCQSTKEKCSVYKNIDNKILVKDLINEVRAHKLERICK